MADKEKSPATRKAARALPLTHRQQRATKRPQSEQMQATSVPTRRASAPTRRKKSAAQALATAPLAVSPTLDSQPTAGPATLEAQADTASLSASLAATEAGRESVWLADTTLLREPPATAASAGVEAPADGEAPMGPRRVRVRVRRKRPASVEATPAGVAPMDITRVDTTILPSISVVAPGETQPSPSSSVALPLIAVDGAPVEVAPVEATPIKTVNSPEIDEPATAESIAERAPVDEAPAPAEPLTPEIVASETAEDPEQADSPAIDEADEDQTHSAPARRMPTLAVMAALTQRAEPATPPAPSAEEDAVPQPRAARPTVPVSEAERLGVSALDTGRLVTPTPEPVVAEAAPEPPVDEPPATSAPQRDASAASSSHRMWWPRAAQQRAAPETRPIPMTSELPADADLDMTAPRPAVRRALSTQPISEAQATWRIVSPGEPPAEPKPEPKAEPLAEAPRARRRRATSVQRRAEAKHARRAAVLSWVAFGHATVAAVAALVAVIAALRGPAANDALTVFAWAVALALIAGVGAAVGYVCAQFGLPRLATSALLLSQLAVLAWALGLLGPRAALLALAPASAALALRGAGRLSAVATGLAWIILFIVDEALALTGVLTPTLPLGEAAAALVDVALTLVGLWLVVNILVSLYTSRMNAVAHGRAVEHVALLTEEQLHKLRMRTEDDAAALRQALADALRGEQPERVYAHGALSVVGELVNEMADRLIDLRYDRAERKRLESAARRLTRVIERAWLGLAWSWPDATGTMLDDLLALLRTPPPPDAPDLFDENAPTGQVVAPHLFRGWRPSESSHQGQRPAPPAAQPGTPSEPSQPSAPTLPSLWPSDAGVRLTNPLELPPSPRWRSPDARLDAPDQTGATER